MSIRPRSGANAPLQTPSRSRLEDVLAVGLAAASRSRALSSVDSPQPLSGQEGLLYRRPPRARFEEETVGPLMHRPLVPIEAPKRPSETSGDPPPAGAKKKATAAEREAKKAAMDAELENENIMVAKWKEEEEEKDRTRTPYDKVIYDRVNETFDKLERSWQRGLPRGEWPTPEDQQVLKKNLEIALIRHNQANGPRNRSHQSDHLPGPLLWDDDKLQRKLFTRFKSDIGLPLGWVAYQSYKSNATLTDEAGKWTVSGNARKIRDLYFYTPGLTEWARNVGTAKDILNETTTTRQARENSANSVVGTEKISTREIRALTQFFATWQRDRNAPLPDPARPDASEDSGRDVSQPGKERIDRASARLQKNTRAVGVANFNLFESQNRAELAKKGVLEQVKEVFERVNNSENRQALEKFLNGFGYVMVETVDYNNRQHDRYEYAFKLAPAAYDLEEYTGSDGEAWQTDATYPGDTEVGPKYEDVYIVSDKKIKLAKSEYDADGHGGAWDELWTKMPKDLLNHIFMTRIGNDEARRVKAAEMDRRTAAFRKSGSPEEIRLQAEDADERARERISASSVARLLMLRYWEQTVFDIYGEGILELMYTAQIDAWCKEDGSRTPEAYEAFEDAKKGFLYRVVKAFLNHGKFRGGYDLPGGYKLCSTEPFLPPPSVAEVLLQFGYVKDRGQHREVQPTTQYSIDRSLKKVATSHAYPDLLNSASVIVFNVPQIPRYKWINEADQEASDSEAERETYNFNVFVFVNYILYQVLLNLDAESGRSWVDDLGNHFYDLFPGVKTIDPWKFAQRERKSVANLRRASSGVGAGPSRA